MSSVHTDQSLAFERVSDPKLNRQRQRHITSAVRQARHEAGERIARGETICCEALVDQARKMAVDEFDRDNGLVSRQDG